MLLSDEDMFSIVYGQQSNKEHYSYNINQLKNVAEEMISLDGNINDKKYISTTSGNNFKCACYKGHNCNVHDHMYDDVIAAAWGYATGESLCKQRFIHMTIHAA